MDLRFKSTFRMNGVHVERINSNTRLSWSGLIQITKNGARTRNMNKLCNEWFNFNRPLSLNRSFAHTHILYQASHSRKKYFKEKSK